MVGVWLHPKDIAYTRIDSEFYHPEYVEHERFVQQTAREISTPVVPLGSIAKLKTGPFGSKLPSSLYRENGIPLFRSQNVVPFFPKKDNMVFLDSVTHVDLKASEILPGSLLMSKAGRVGDTCILTNEFGPSNITEHVMGIDPIDDVDPYYLVAVINSIFSKKQAQRFGLGTLINYLGVEVTRAIRLVLPEEKIQNAIGKKIKKAERLNELIKLKEHEINRIIKEDLVWDAAKHNIPTLSSWIKNDELDNRLDGKFNTPKRIGILRHLRKYKFDHQKLNDLCDISAMIGWKGLTTDHYTTEGPYLIRGVDFDNGLLNEDNLVHVDYEKYAEQPQIHLKAYDIIMTKDGTIGKALTVPDLNHDMCAGSTIARLRNKSDIPSHYFEAILNHEVVQIQIQSFATGLAQPHITQEWIAELIIPILPSYDDIARETENHHRNLLFSKMLIEEAQNDIDALIDVTLDIDKLISEGEEIDRWLNDNPSPNISGRNS